MKKLFKEIGKILSYCVIIWVAMGLTLPVTIKAVGSNVPDLLMFHPIVVAASLLLGLLLTAYMQHREMTAMEESATKPPRPYKTQAEIARHHGEDYAEYFDEKEQSSGPGRLFSPDEVREMKQASQ